MAASPATVNPDGVTTPDLSADLAQAGSVAVDAGSRDPLSAVRSGRPVFGEAPSSLYKLLFGPAYAAATTPGVVPDASSARIVARDGALGALDDASGRPAGADLTRDESSCLRRCGRLRLAQVVGRYAMITVATEAA